MVIFLFTTITSQKETARLRFAVTINCARLLPLTWLHRIVAAGLRQYSASNETASRRQCRFLGFIYDVLPAGFRWVINRSGHFFRLLEVAQYVQYAFSFMKSYFCSAKMRLQLAMKSSFSWSSNLVFLVQLSFHISLSDGALFVWWSFLQLKLDLFIWKMNFKN